MRNDSKFEFSSSTLEMEISMAGWREIKGLEEESRIMEKNGEDDDS